MTTKRKENRPTRCGHKRVIAENGVRLWALCVKENGHAGNHNFIQPSGKVVEMEK
jgi:hypothetical protein